MVQTLITVVVIKKTKKPCSNSSLGHIYAHRAPSLIIALFRLNIMVM